MLFSIKVFTLLVAAATVSAVPDVSGVRDGMDRRAESRNPELNPPPSVVQPSKRDVPAIPAGHRRHTNAERFARGLPPITPRKLWSRSHAARTPTTSSFPPDTLQGRLKVTRASAPADAQPEYISSLLNKFGENVWTQDEFQALSVRITVLEGGETDQHDLTITNPANSDFTLLSAIQGFSSTSANLLPNSANYLYIGASTGTVPGSRPTEVPNTFTKATNIVKNVESAIWVFNLDTRAVTAKWINTGGAVVVPQFVYCAKEEAFFLVGDYAAFTNTFKCGELVTLTFVPV